jgi:hypothetical protein
MVPRINYQDFLYGISLPDIHLDLVFINDVLICQTLCPITLILQLPAWYQGKIKMSAISKEKIKILVLTKIQDIWTE